METKEKVIKILKALWLAVATVLSIVFIIACIVGGVSNKKQKESVSACVENDIIAYNINNDINKGIKQSVFNPIKQAVVYDDENYTIELVGVECSYQFNNLATLISNEGLNYTNYLDTDIELTISSLEFSDTIFSYDEIEEGVAMSYVYTHEVTDYILRLFYEDESNFGYFYIVINEGIDSDTNRLSAYENVRIHWNLNSTIYNNIKSAIELDIQANQKSINDGVFETLTASTVGFIGTISSGITSIMAVFYAENTLTVIGKLSVIVVAVGLTYFLFRLIVGLVRMRG